MFCQPMVRQASCLCMVVMVYRMSQGQYGIATEPYVLIKQRCCSLGKEIQSILYAQMVIYLYVALVCCFSCNNL